MEYTINRIFLMFSQIKIIINQNQMNKKYILINNKNLFKMEI